MVSSREIIEAKKTLNTYKEKHNLPTFDTKDPVLKIAERFGEERRKRYSYVIEGHEGTNKSYIELADIVGEKKAEKIEFDAFKKSNYLQYKEREQTCAVVLNKDWKITRITVCRGRRKAWVIINRVPVKMEIPVGEIYTETFEENADGF